MHASRRARNARCAHGRAILAAAVTVSAALLALTGVAPAAAADGWAPAHRVVAAIAPLSVSAVMDLDGHIHVAYLEDHAPGGLMVATDKGGWHTQLVVPGVGFEAQPSIAVDVFGHTWVAYARMTCPDEIGGICDDPDDVPISRIHVATDRSGTWRSRPRSAGPADVWPALAFAEGKLHIAFQRQLWPPGQAGSGVWYLTNVGGWHESQVASGQGRCFLDQLPSIEASAGGTVWIAYEAARRPVNGCGGTLGIRVATNTPVGWSRETVSSDREDAHPVLALDRQGRPALVFDRGGLGVRFSRRIDGDWTATEAVTGGAEADLTFDDHGYPRVAAEGGGGIQVARRTAHGFVRTTVYRGPVDYGTYGGPAIVMHPVSGLARVVFGRSEPDDTPLEDELGVYLVRERP